MATASQIKLAPETAGLFAASRPTDEATTKASELLQENHDKHHIFFRDDGFHNHIAHHLLAIYSLGASPKELEDGFNFNKGYQLPPKPVHGKLPIDLADTETFKKYLGSGEHYHDYLVFFQQQIETIGYENTIKTYLLKNDDLTNNMLVRLFAGFLHPIIHVGYGVEYRQPAIIAEGLAETAVHSDWIAPLFIEAERAASQMTTPEDADAASQPSTQVKPKTLIQLAQEARKNEKLRLSAHEDDGNKIRDGILKRAPQEMIQLAAQWTAKPDELEQKAAEVVSFAAYMTATAQHPPNIVKMDFFYMHAINTCPMLCSMLDVDWLSPEQKCRLLEWKAREDLALYVSRGSPELRASEISGYRPKQADKSDWPSLFRRATSFLDDGHTSKFVRALAFGQQRCKRFEGEEWCVVSDDDWRIMANMVLDSVEGEAGEETRWVRNAGWDSAWKDIPLRDEQSQL